MKKPIPEKNLEAGIRGTVLLVYNEMNLSLAYEMEFLDKNGKTLAFITVIAEDLERISSTESS